MGNNLLVPLDERVREKILELARNVIFHFDKERFGIGWSIFCKNCGKQCDFELQDYNGILVPTKVNCHNCCSFSWTLDGPSQKGVEIRNGPWNEQYYHDYGGGL